MLTSINIANALSTVAANVDGSFVTQDNAIFATGYSNGSAVLNVGRALVTADFAASGSAVYDTANNHVQVADGSFLTFEQNGANIALVAQGNVGGMLDLNAAGLSFTPDIGDGTLGVSVDKDGATFDVSLDGTGTMTVNLINGVPVLTVPKDFSLNFAAKTYTGIPLTGTVYGDGVNDVYATLVNGTQIALTTNGAVGANLNFGGVPLNNVTLSGSLILDPLSNTLTFGQGSTLGVDLGTRHIDITATDSAGGQLTFGTNGLNFKTAGGDGGLILSVTENGVTRQASLNVVGEVTYSLDGSITLGAGTTVTNSWPSGAALSITSNTGGGAVVHLTDDGLQVTTTDPEAITATFSSEVSEPLTNIKLTGTATYNSGSIILSEGSTLTAIWDTISDIPVTVIASSSDTTFQLITALTPDVVFSTAGQCIFIVGDKVRILSHGSRIGNPSRFMQLSAGTDFIINTERTIMLSDVGVYAVNGTLITNYVAGSMFVSNPDGSLVYNGVTYAAGEFTIDAEGNGIGTVISADLAGDFLPNYNDDFANALQIVDAGTFDNQLSEILPAENLGEVAFGTQADELSQTPQLVITSDK